MSTGTGVFLGLVCIAAVLLYAQTKDRAHWRPIIKWAVAGALLIGGIGLSYVQIREYQRNRVVPPEKYLAVALGDSKRQVLYAKGQPTHVLEEPPDNTWPGLRVISRTDLPEGKDVLDYAHWSYESTDEGRVDIDFVGGEQTVSRVFCFSEEGADCQTLAGVAPGMTEETVIEKLGSPSSSWLAADTSGVKYMTYSALRVGVFLRQQRVYALQLEGAPRAQSQGAQIGSRRLDVPAECESVRTARECADVLAKAGKNPFDAFGAVGDEPVYDRQPAPPCINGAARCAPWERDWSTVDVPPGTVVTEDGFIVGSSSLTTAP